MNSTTDYFKNAELALGATGFCIDTLLRSLRQQCFNARTAPQDFIPHRSRGKHMRALMISAGFLLTLVISGCAHAITADEFKAARPEILFKNMHEACRYDNQEQMFAQHSRYFEQAFLQVPAERRRTIFSEYCQGVRKLVEQLGGQPENAAYLIKESKRIRDGQRRAILCVLPKGHPEKNCWFGFHVTIEDGQLKKDEF